MNVRHSTVLPRYLAMAGVVPRLFLAYRAWFWVGILLNIIAMAIFVFFWRAVYESADTISGLTLSQTLTYILLARIFEPLLHLFAIWDIGYNVREGTITVGLLRPVDLQGTYYAQSLVNTLMFLLWQIPMILVAMLLFGLRFPADPATWLVFIVSAFLGKTVLFFFDWILACITFYTTEVWGLSVLIEGVSMFLSGALVPLVMMPGWLRGLAEMFPFAQALYVPLSLLTGITPLSEAPRVWLVQLAWLVGLGVTSRLLFRVAVRKVTVQGG